MNKYRRLWRAIRASFWFVPALLVAVSIFVAMALIELDTAGSGKWQSDWPRLFGASAAGARGMLSTIAGSMMTVVGVTFSMVLVTLALASSQYSSRILRNFIQDGVTQVVLGIFAGTFTYCLIVLRTIRGSDAGDFVPSLAVTFGVVLAVGGIGTLIYFIHHVAFSIQASSIIAAVADETMLAIDRLFPEKLGEGPADKKDCPAAPLSEANWQPIVSPMSGYIQTVDNKVLLRMAKKHKTLVRMERGIGDFVVRNTPLISIAMSGPPDKELIDSLQWAYSIDRHRTLEQDAGFGIRQLVDMAMRALSPSTNDTTTAVMCVDYLTAILSRVAARKIPSPYRYEEGELRVIAMAPDFAHLVAVSFDQIRDSAEGNVGIMLRMLGGLQTIGNQTDNASHQKILLQHARWIGELAGRTLKGTRDQERLALRLARVTKALENSAGQSAETD
jgi:uncharacterized membrane protein